MGCFKLQWKSVLVAFLVFCAFACGGGGCSSCAGCGITPIPGGFPIADRISNAAQVRLTESGVTFLEDNIAAILDMFLPGGLDFPISSGVDGAAGSVCGGGGCFIHGDITGFTLTPQAPNRLVGHVRMRIFSADAAGAPAPIRKACFDVLVGTMCCSLRVDTARGARPYVGMIANVDFVAETQPVRDGYTKIVVLPGGGGGSYWAPGEDIENDDMYDFSGTGFSLCGIGNLGFVKNIIRREINSQFGSQIQSAIDAQMCTTQGDFGCPMGTFADGPGIDAVCHYTSPTGPCVPPLLGTDGEGDLGAAAFASMSPGTHGPGQFLLASGGDGEAVMGGLSLFFFGGYRGTDRTYVTAPVHDPCVPLLPQPALPTIPRTDTFRANVIPGAGTPAHVGIGIAEDYLNYAGYGMFDSGMLCLGLGTRTSQQLSTGLFSLVARSMTRLTFPGGVAPLSIALRPQEPPRFDIGTATGTPLLTVTLPKLQADFYVWSTERYIRMLTYEADLAIEMDLTATAGEIVPTITSVTATGSTVTNSELLRDDPAMLAPALEGIISSFAGSLGSSLSPIALPAIMGFDLAIPAGGIVGVDEAGARFLGIFADLSLAPAPAPYIGTVDTTAVLDELRVDEAALSLETFGQGEVPWARIDVGGEGPAGAELEYSTRIDGSYWSPFEGGPSLIVQDRVLFLQAHHVLEVRARVVGAPRTVDLTPAAVDLLVDALPPTVRLAPVTEGTRIEADDMVSASRALEVRWREGAGAFNEWRGLGRSGVLVPGGDEPVDILAEVRDEAGNIGSAEAQLVRGLPNPTAAGGGCGCAVAGDSQAPWGWSLLLLLVACVALRRRLRARYLLRRAWVVALPFVLGVAGCSCSDPPGTGPCGGMCEAAVAPATSGTICCDVTTMCTPYDLATFCGPGMHCSGEAALVFDSSCGLTCSDCVRAPPADPGMMATHLDMVASPDGSLFLSGYAPGLPGVARYGDLVAGPVDPATSVATWEIIDGAPTGPVSHDPDGFRGGVIAPGDDVGRWTSLAKSGGLYFIAYYDRTNAALKIAIGSPGSWTTHTIDDTGDSGRYASLVLDAADNPMVAYLRIERAADMSGRIVSSAMVAATSSPAPASAVDWTLTEVGSAFIPCRPDMCAPGESCLDTGECVTATADCAAACASGETCYTGTCRPALSDPFIEDMPPAYGMYNALARTAAGFALVFYDRSTGNIMGAAHDGTAWGRPFLIDGYAASDPFVGDCGIGASLYIDPFDVWHVSYVDGTEENLRYARIDAGLISTVLVDNGATDGTSRHADGRHIVGDDSSIVVTDAGDVRIVYQDATAHRAMVAIQPGGVPGWTINVLDSADHTGFWLEQALVGPTSHVVTFWRNEIAPATYGVRILTL